MKNKQKLLQTLVLLFFMTISYSQNWQLVWQDEFTNGISPDWVFETGNGGWGNHELQYYRQQNTTVSDGKLIITAKNENFGGSNYTSARLTTQGKKSWKYGKIEARIAMPSFQGIWPGFWMLGDNISNVNVGWPKCGEIDIMEHINVGGDVFGTIHWDNNGHVEYGGRSSTNITTFHTYAVEWDENTIKWLIDGNKFHEVSIAGNVNSTDEFHDNFFLILNLAVGGDWPKFNIDNSAFPAQMQVDYVRVYQKVSNQPSVLIQAENYSAMSGIQVESTTDIGGGSNVGYTDTGDWMAYNNINFPTSGSYLIEYRVASAVNGSKLSSDLNGGKIPLGVVNINNTHGWQNWETVSQNIPFINAGTYNFGIFIQNSGVNINWIKITKVVDGLSSKNNSTKKVEEVTLEKTLKIYPSPVQNTLYFDIDVSVENVSIVDSLSGLVISNQKINNNSLDVSGLKPGIYLIVLEKDGKKIVTRFIKK